MWDLLLPARCALCGSPRSGLCAPCVRRLPPAPLRSPPPGLSGSWGLVAYDGPGRDLVVAAKFRNRRGAIGPLADAMAEMVEVEPVLVTWAPSSTSGVRERGGSLAELLAVGVASRLGRPCRQLVRRVDDREQKHQSRQQRLTGVDLVALPDAQPPRSGTVLIVDDVRTTGATLCSVSDELLRVGVPSTCALTLAVTP